MAKMHNKKRNVGIIYEQIINFICQKTMENNSDASEMAINIIKKHFDKNTQLYKEYKLFKALVTTHNMSDHLATSIINEAKKACNHMFDSDILEKQKSSLIKDLNYTFGKGVIFEQKVKDYRMYATIQTLLNEWRNELKNFDKVTEYEILLHESLVKNHEVDDHQQIPKIDNLTRKIMKEIFTKKYSSQLNKTQRDLISIFIKDDENQLSEMYQEIKKSSKKLLENYIQNCNNNILIEKYSRVNNQINKSSVNDISKENLQKFLTIAKLKEELLGE